MPTYDYHCDHCGHNFATVQSFADNALSVCPGCGKEPRRLINAPNIVFKGSGWYKTDSRPTPAAEGAAMATKTGAEPAAGTDGKADAKAGVKSEAKTDGGTTDGATGKSKPAEVPTKPKPASPSGDSAPSKKES